MSEEDDRRRVPPSRSPRTPSTSLTPSAERWPGKYQAAAPLTRSARAAQLVVKARRASSQSAAKSSAPRQEPTSARSLPLWTCPDCGGAVTNPRHVPAEAAEIRGRRGAAIAARKRALTEWDSANSGTVYDPELFRRDILPRLRTVPLAEIMEAAGCCKASASDYRRGKRTPHASTWGALAALIGAR